MKLKIARIAAAAALIIIGLITDPGTVWKYVIFGAAYLIAGYDVLIEAFENIIHGELFDEGFLMTVASAGAFIIGEQFEGAVVMTLFQIGELLEDVASDRARDRIKALCDTRPDTARVVSGSGVAEKRAEEVKVGEIMLIKAGERVPLDGEITEGMTELDCSSVTGESMPVPKQAGDSVLSGCVNLRGEIKARVVREYSDSQVTRVLGMVEDAAVNKARSEQFITRFSRIYTPSVVGVAVFLAVVGSIITGNTWEWVHRALMFLVISCPCALVISVPLTFFGGLGALSREGVLVKGSTYMDMLAHVTAGAFDKTGTLTTGDFSLDGEHDPELLRIAAHVEAHSNHPLAQAVVKGYGGDIDAGLVTNVEEIAGKGVSALYDGKATHVGNGRLMAENGISVPESDGAHLYVAHDNRYIGKVSLRDRPRGDAGKVLGELKGLGVRRLIMLTGDNESAARQAAEELSVDEYRAGLLPEEKLEYVKELIKAETKGEKLFFVGDGINDAPALALADVGVAMGAMGADAAIEAADVALMNDSISKLPLAIRHSRFTLKVVWQNIILAIGIKFAVMILSALGITGMGAAVFADVGVCLIAIANASRTMRVRKTEQ